MAGWYWGFRNELTTDDQVLLKGECVVLPPSCRDRILANLHQSHHSIQEALDLAQSVVYWPGMEADITNYVKQCPLCIESQNLPVDTLHPTRAPLDLGSR